MSVKNAREIADKNALRFDNWHLTKRNRAEMTAELARNAGRRTAGRSEARRVVWPTAPRTATRGGGLQTGRAKPFLLAAQLSSPPTRSLFRVHIHVAYPHSVSFLRRPGVGGVVLKPGRKNETVERPRPKNKNFGGRKRHICDGEVRPLCGGGARVPAGC